MARKQNLKVYRTPIGFHDAYVAAPSQKAALEAWGSDANLFARGIAEIVTDEVLSREPLASPGKVIRKLRGTAAEQIAALPPSLPTASKSRTVAETDAPHPRRPKAAPVKAKAPKPDRSALDDARRAIAEAEDQHERARKEIAKRQTQLDSDRKALEMSYEAEITRLQRESDQTEDAYNRALREWRG